MKKKFQLALATAAVIVLALSLSACKDELIPLTKAKPNQAFLVTATIPHNGQYSVPLSSPVVIHFPEDIEPTSITGLVHLTDASGEAASFTTDVFAGSIILKPTNLWKTHTTYTLTIDPGVVSKNFETSTDQRIVTFETGVRRPVSAERLSIQHVTPSSDAPCWDFQTFRIQFNQPVTRTTLEYGTTVLLTDVETGVLVPGNLFGRGNQISFDPDSDLLPDRQYQLKVTTGLKDYSGRGMLDEYSVTYTVSSSGKRAYLALDKCPTAVEGPWFCAALPQDSLFPKSTFINQEVNSMLANSTLLGTTKLLVGSRLWNEFGEAKVSPNRIPLVVRKGQKLIAGSINSKIGGALTTGTTTGPIEITVLTDAVGEMLGSEYIHGVPGLPASILLSMDVSMSAPDGGSCSIMGQPIIGATLVGQASVGLIDESTDYQAMQIELAGFSEIQILDEFVPVSMALKMVPPPEKPEQESDSTPPSVVSVSPVDFPKITPNEHLDEELTTRSAGDEIVIAFSEPIGQKNYQELVYVLGPEGRLSGRYDLYEPKIVFVPDAPLEPDTQYTIVVKSGVEDISGNKSTEHGEYVFTTMPHQSSAVQPPMINVMSPGIIEGVTLPANFYPEVYFSQLPDAETLIYGDPDDADSSSRGTVAIFDDDKSGALVPATLFHRGLYFKLVPDEELETHHQYRMVVTQDITNLDGLQLDTDMDGEPGGPNVVNTFTATPAAPVIQSMLYTLPYGDADNNGYIDGEESELTTNYMHMNTPIIEGDSFMMGYFPLTVHALITDSEGEPRVPIEIQPNAYLFSSNYGIKLGGWSPDFLQSGRTTIRLLDGSSTDLYPAPDGLVGVDADTSMIFSMENDLLNTFLVPEAIMKIPSRLRVSNDGRLLVLIDGTTEVNLRVPLVGEIPITVDAKMTTSTSSPTLGF